MTKMSTPEVKVVRFTESDVIVASATFTFNNLGDGVANGTIGYGGKEYSIYLSGPEAFYQAFYDNTNIAIGDYTPVYYGEETTHAYMSSADQYDYDGRYSDYNGAYYWDNGVFKHQ